MEYEKAITEKHIFNYLIKHREMLLKNDMIVAKKVVNEFVEFVEINKDTAKIAFRVSVVSNDNYTVVGTRLK